MNDYKVTFPFGPLIYTTDISGEFHQFLLDGLEDCRKAQDARGRLVGNINQQRYAPYEPQKFTKFLDPHIVNYLTEKHKRINQINEICNKEIEEWDHKKSEITYDLGEGPWVIFQKKGEFNPMHNHGGVVSVVIFIKIPKELDEERSKSTFSAKASSCLEFMHLDQHIIVNPKECMMYMFPSFLWHAVYPFLTDTERVSMSLNFHQITIDGKPVPANDNIIFYKGDVYPPPPQ